MAFRVTMIRRAGGDARSASVEAATEIEAARIARRRAAVAARWGRSVVCEARHESGRLVVSYDSESVRT